MDGEGTTRRRFLEGAIAGLAGSSLAPALLAGIVEEDREVKDGI
ncbi:MAG: twin-arginine translocation signal domain-containing protein, partial [Planctomycetes bacterium]|nr:twin-arginine translocation signal domain-containing protein [Planctomycetota bacterium]